MVNVRLESGKEESAALYNTVELTAEESGNVECGDVSGEDSDADMEVDESMLHQFRFEIAHKRWSALYDREGALKLKSAMMQHLFKQKFGANAVTTAYDMVDSYNPLSC